MEGTRWCFVASKCLVACLFLEESQHPTCPHDKQSRRCTQVSPVLRQSSQPSGPGGVSWRESVWWRACSWRSRNTLHARTTNRVERSEEHTSELQSLRHLV